MLATLLDSDAFLVKETQSLITLFNEKVAHIIGQDQLVIVFYDAFALQLPYLGPTLAEIFICL